MKENCWPDHRPDIFPAEITKPCSVRLRWSSDAFQDPLFAAVSRIFHTSSHQSFQLLRGPLLPGHPGVLDPGLLDV
ncbi:hypothetical protein ACFWOJ_19715 [Streptomyces sp. NPDC058439]|uniref:hypothetical protein n=1 Tax=Streptomyces sp. NPDC058439 TaxID=3346500 RepID=UPI0036499757